MGAARPGDPRVGARGPAAVDRAAPAGRRGDAGARRLPAGRLLADPGCGERDRAPSAHLGRQLDDHRDDGACPAAARAHAGRQDPRRPRRHGAAAAHPVALEAAHGVHRARRAAPRHLPPSDPSAPPVRPARPVPAHSRMGVHRHPLGAPARARAGLLLRRRGLRPRRAARATRSR